MNLPLTSRHSAWYVSPFMHHEPEPDAMAAALAKSRDYLKECYAKAVP